MFEFLPGTDGSPGTPLAEISIPASAGMTWIEVSDSHPWIGWWERRKPLSEEGTSAAVIIATAGSLMPLQAEHSSGCRRSQLSQWSL